MEKKAPVHDPLWGTLTWQPSHREWTGRVWLTPKHPVPVSVYDPELGESETWDEAMAPARAAHLANLQREWEFRLVVAEALVGAELIEGPPEEAARRVRLTSILVYAHAAGDWHYTYQGEAEIKGFPAMLEVSADGVLEVHF